MGYISPMIGDVLKSLPEEHSRVEEEKVTEEQEEVIEDKVKNFAKVTK